MLKIENLKIGYTTAHGKTIAVLENLCLSAKRGELIALIGENGAGKSSLLRTIVKLQKPLSGKISLDDKNINTYLSSRFARRVAFVSTEPVQASYLKVFDLICLGRFPHTNWFGHLDQEDYLKINEAIELMGMQKFVDKNLNQLSDGERQRAMIARTLAQDTDLIVLDEPTAFLDLPNKYEIVHALGSLCRKKNKTILFSTHDLNIALRQADKIWMLAGKQIFEGAPEDLVLNNMFDRLFDQSSLHFDSKLGDFMLPSRTGIPVTLIGSGLPALWTQKALERLNYKVVSGDSDLSVTIAQNEGKFQWILKKNDAITYADSIYSLSLLLKK